MSSGNLENLHLLKNEYLVFNGDVKLNNYCTMYYCRLIYEPCLHKRGLLLYLSCHVMNCSASLEISLPYQAIYQYLLDNLVSGPLFVPTVIAALHPSNRLNIFF